ncbi:hypothetical protein BU14_0294s0009 [Porphyra umbilicalis]|uniref:Uncharacterized protein n=1 Tax=Porphyra umbilicalis TaxID=2786 RepID=A0A1X6P0D2_PORUM|nr:hypothetical protein BU14_0294s0009 [Porphyra umbilicalis]|eukprot:OSX74318.1 hypothetical protein BU14_0294s0009 [Porphyra umbilicalis]
MMWTHFRSRNRPLRGLPRPDGARGAGAVWCKQRPGGGGGRATAPAAPFCSARPAGQRRGDGWGVATVAGHPPTGPPRSTRCVQAGPLAPARPPVRRRTWFAGTGATHPIAPGRLRPSPPDQRAVRPLSPTAPRLFLLPQSSRPPDCPPLSSAAPVWLPLCPRPRWTPLDPFSSPSPPNHGRLCRWLLPRRGGDDPGGRPCGRPPPPPDHRRGRGRRPRPPRRAPGDGRWGSDGRQHGRARRCRL